MDDSQPMTSQHGSRSAPLMTVRGPTITFYSHDLAREFLAPIQCAMLSAYSAPLLAVQAPPGEGWRSKSLAKAIRKTSASAETPASSHNIVAESAPAVLTCEASTNTEGLETQLGPETVPQNATPDSASMAKNTDVLSGSFDELMSTYEDEIRILRQSTRHGNWQSHRDIMRAFQDRFWKDWVDKFYGGTGDPAFQNSSQLRTFLHARAAWDNIQHTQGLMNKSDQTSRAHLMEQASRKLEITAT